MIIVGIDEVGRGCWAGPLVAAAVQLDPKRPISGLNDSKKLSKARRQLLAQQIEQTAVAIGIGWAWPEDIDISGITSSVKSAMMQAIQQIDVNPASSYDHIIIDGNYNYLPEYDRVTTLIRADGSIPAVSAASIIAKVARDTYMSEVAAKLYPAYGFERHVGYGTAQHIAMLQLHGATKLHRMSYKPLQHMKLASDE